MNNSGSNVLLFLQELVQRFVVKTPKFFRIWQWVLSALLLITGIPAFLLQFNVHLPTFWEEMTNKAVAYASVGAMFMTLLTTQSKPISVENDGTVVKETNPKDLPFTAKHEEKQMIKSQTNDLT